jgi:hypothetical protein
MIQVKKNIQELSLKSILNLANLTDSNNRLGKTILKVEIPFSHFDGYNLWILKVTRLNRGRGIYVFDTLEKLLSLIKELREGIILGNNTESETNPTDTVKDKPQSFSNLSAVPNIIKSSTFVIQKYIERPILINKRKFDIRVWVLVTHDLKIYFFKEGYLRTSCEAFSLESEDVN